MAAEGPFVMRPVKLRVIRGLKRPVALKLRKMAVGHTGEGEDTILVTLYLDIQWRWVATILIRSPGSQDRHLAIRTHDFDKVREFLGTSGGQASKFALSDLGLPPGFGRSLELTPPSDCRSP